MTEPKAWIAVAFPEREEDLARLRALRHPGDPKLPAKYPDAVVLPCAVCAMPLSVGPRLAAKVKEGMELNCPWCMAKKSEGDSTQHIMSLGNPDSKTEE